MADLFQSGQHLSLIVTGDEYLPARAGRTSGIEVTVTVCVKPKFGGKKRAADTGVSPPTKKEKNSIIS